MGSMLFVQSTDSEKSNFVRLIKAHSQWFFFVFFDVILFKMDK